MSKHHAFTKEILDILRNRFQENAEIIFGLSPLLKYINNKTRSANSGSKSRGSFANLYALYVLIEDYLEVINRKKDYESYKGADFTPLLEKIRKMPFGSKLQNHALNSRANDEFHKYFHDIDVRPIIREVSTQKYWINQNLLKVKIDNKEYNIADSILKIIDKYIMTKKESFAQFIEDCKNIQNINNKEFLMDKEYKKNIFNFIKDLLKPEKDARIFEIVSYAILKVFYSEKIIFIGENVSSLKVENLKLYKTGRTNANDGGIDFVMKPLGRFFQVTETLDVKKYFLDIDKVEHYPITFVIKSNMDEYEIRKKLMEGAREQYPVDDIVKRYMSAIEEIINTEYLLDKLDILLKNDKEANIINEIILWSVIEFNYIHNNNLDTVVDADEDE